MNIILDGYKYLKECFSQLKKKTSGDDSLETFNARRDH